MIGSHNSYTFLKSTNGYNKLSKYWKCQTKTIEEQLEVGVRFFDIRVKEEVKNQRRMWRVCHGAAELDKVFSSITTLCTYFTKLGVKFRLILEKGDSTFFKTEIEKNLDKYKNNITQVVIKKDWQVLYEDWKGIYINFYTFNLWNKDWSLLKNIKHFLSSTIKNWAAEHNPAITKEMIDDEKELYFMDYV